MRGYRSNKSCAEAGKWQARAKHLETETGRSATSWPHTPVVVEELITALDVLGRKDSHTVVAIDLQCGVCVWDGCRSSCQVHCSIGKLRFSIKHTTTRHSTAQHSTAQHSTAQRSTSQRSTCITRAAQLGRVLWLANRSLLPRRRASSTHCWLTLNR